MKAIAESQSLRSINLGYLHAEPENMALLMLCLGKCASIESIELQQYSRGKERKHFNASSCLPEISSLLKSHSGAEISMQAFNFSKQDVEVSD